VDGFEAGGFGPTADIGGGDDHVRQVPQAVTGQSRLTAGHPSIHDLMYDWACVATLKRHNSHHAMAEAEERYAVIAT
jgi:hypothetical protein